MEGKTLGRVISIRIPKKLLRDIDAGAKVARRTRSDYMRLALEEAVGRMLSRTQESK